MKRNERKKLVSETLREAITRSGLSDYRIAQGSGVDANAIGRFRRGESTLRGDRIDALADYFGLELVHDPNAVPPEPTPENLARPKLAEMKKSRRKVE